MVLHFLCNPPESDVWTHSSRSGDSLSAPSSWTWDNKTCSNSSCFQPVSWPLHQQRILFKLYKYSTFYSMQSISQILRCWVVLTLHDVTTISTSGTVWWLGADGYGENKPVCQWRWRWRWTLGADWQWWPTAWTSRRESGLVTYCAADNEAAKSQGQGLSQESRSGGDVLGKKLILWAYSTDQLRCSWGACLESKTKVQYHELHNSTWDMHLTCLLSNR